MPMTWQILSVVKADHILRGTSTGWSLEATSHRMLTQVFELLFRSPRHRPFEVGQTSSNQGLTVTVSALRDGTPYAVDFVLDGVNFGAEVWAWTPYRHTDGSWHAYYTANAFEIMYAQPDPPTQQWTAAQPILKWKTVSKLISVKGA